MDWSWLFLVVPLAFAAGWFASRMDLRQLKAVEGQQPKAFFRGLNHLLNEEQDQAIDAFVEAVTHDPEASELHFALGNLFRRRGDYERAVRVHTHMLTRGDISKSDGYRAQQALAQDFWTAGLLDRAQAAFEALLETPLVVPARVGLLAVFERGRDWAAALDTAKALRADSQALVSVQADDPATRAVLSGLAARIAHYSCEMAGVHLAAGELTQAQRAWDTAAEACPNLVRPWVEAGRWKLAQGDHADALSAFNTAVRLDPGKAPLIAAEMVVAAKALGHDAEQRIHGVLRQLHESQPSLDVMNALASLAGSIEEARHAYMQHLQKRPSLVAATRWLALERLEHEQFHPEVQAALDLAVKPLQRYQCGACGFSSLTHFWQCPGCQSWDSMPAQRAEEVVR